MLMIASLPKSTRKSDVLDVAKAADAQSSDARQAMREASDLGDFQAYRAASKQYVRATSRANAWHKAWRGMQ